MRVGWKFVRGIGDKVIDVLKAEAPFTSIADVVRRGKLTRPEVLSFAQAGYRYSSSVYPIAHDLYGVPDAPRRPFCPQPGCVVAKINDLIVNRSNGTVELAILTPAERISADKRRTTVAWSSLRFEGKPTPHFVTSLSPQELAAGTSFKQQAESRDDFYDVKTDLLGKSVSGSDGSHLGKIQDLAGCGKIQANEQFVEFSKVILS